MERTSKRFENKHNNIYFKHDTLSEQIFLIMLLTIFPQKLCVLIQYVLIQIEYKIETFTFLYAGYIYHLDKVFQQFFSTPSQWFSCMIYTTRSALENFVFLWYSMFLLINCGLILSHNKILTFFYKNIKVQESLSNV